MEYVKLGNSDLIVSKICLGCMGFGEANSGMHTWTLDYEQSKAIIAYSLEKGVNFFDTAMGYSAGTSEIFVGRALKELAKRDDVVIATKYMPRTKDQLDQISGRNHIIQCLNNSLERLGTNYVDLYIMHRWDEFTPIEETLATLDELIKAGKIRAIGISNCFAYQLCKANRIAKEKGYHPFVSIQGHYNLIHREEEREMIPYCKEENIALTPYSALAAGRLARPLGETSKRYQEDTYAKGKYDAMMDHDAKIINKVEELANKKGVSMSAISLAWLYSKVTSPVVGATKTKHIDGAIEALSVNLTDEEVKELEEFYVPHELVGVMKK